MTKAASLNLCKATRQFSVSEGLLFPEIVTFYITLGRDLTNLVYYRNFLRLVSC